MTNSRESLHPLDVAEAVAARRLASGPARLIVSSDEQRRAERLSLLPARVKAMWREGKMSDAAARSFVLARDEAAALALLDAPDIEFVLPWPLDIARRLTAGAVEATHARARFVGVEAYRAAGGAVREDLVGQTFLDDPELLRRMERRKLEDSGKALSARDGWGRFLIDERWQDFKRVPPDFSPDESERLAALDAQELDGAFGEPEWREREAILRVGWLRAIPQAERHRHGVHVSYDTEGRSVVTYGLILSAALANLPRPGAETPPAGRSGAEGDAARGGERVGPRASVEAASPGDETTDDGIPAPSRSETRKIAERAASLAVAARIEADTDLALDAFVAAAVKAGWHVGPVRIERGFGRGADGGHGEFLRTLAKLSFEERLRALLPLDRETLLKLAAQLIAASVDFSRSDAGSARALIAASGTGAAEIAEEFEYDKYFATDRVVALALFDELGGDALARGHAWRGDDDLAREAAKLAKMRGWVPEFLRAGDRSPVIGDRTAEAAS